jgi:hypothetical protein
MATACPRLMPTISACTLHDVRGSGVSLTLRRGTRAEACTAELPRTREQPPSERQAQFLIEVPSAFWARSMSSRPRALAGSGSISIARFRSAIDSARIPWSL